jgi:shikimate dehydrogenase
MRKIDSQTSLYCVIGYPVKHSLSPTIHNSAFEKYEINAVYLAFEIPPNELPNFFQAMRSLGIKGCNITLPHKVNALNYLDKLDKTAKGAGSVNTVLNKDGQLIGYNTDVYGVEASLKDLGLEIKGRRFLLLGAGGAARAVLYCLAEGGADKVYIANRTYSKALNLKDLIARDYPNLKTETLPLEKERLKKVISDIDCLINATSLGIKEDDPLVIDEELLDKSYKVFDLTYNKKGTPLVKEAKKRGVEAIDGIPMLIHQAIKAFQLWHGISVEYSFWERILRRYMR